MSVGFEWDINYYHTGVCARYIPTNVTCSTVCWGGGKETLIIVRSGNSMKHCSHDPAQPNPAPVAKDHQSELISHRSCVQDFSRSQHVMWKTCATSLSGALFKGILRALHICLVQIRGLFGLGGQWQRLDKSFLYNFWKVYCDRNPRQMITDGLQPPERHHQWSGISPPLIFVKYYQLSVWV